MQSKENHKLYENKEFFITLSPSTEIFLQSWSKSETNFKGCVLITHGICEHSQCYTHVAHFLCNQGFLVYAWDLQGHGRSQGKRGFVKNFNEFSKNLISVIKKIQKTAQTPSFHLVGHSMGALITLQALLKKSCPKIASATLSNPALGLSMSVPAFKKTMARWLNQIWPRLTLNSGISYEFLSRDPKMMEIYNKDPLRHSQVSAPLFLGMMAAMKRIPKQIQKLKTPVFFQLSGNDKVVNTQKSLDLFETLHEPKKKLKLYKESYHEIYNDLNKEEVLSDLVDFLNKWNSL